jgi:predicted RNA-binding Zn ribbon-like protein
LKAQPTKTADELPSRAATLDLVADALCLNFTNTTSGRGTAMRQEHLRQWEHLLAWAEHAGVIDRPYRQALQRSSRSAGDETLRRALELREALYDLFRAVIAAEGAPASSSLRPLNRTLSEAMAAADIHPAAEGFIWGWPDDEPHPMRILWSIARSAAELLTGSDLDRVKFCPGHGCGWLFLDKTRNGKRRWCEMEVCGSRAKMRRYHQRRREAAETPF